MPFKQTIFTRNGSNPQAPTEEELPTSLEGWDAVEAVGEGATPFRAKSDDAAFIETKLQLLGNQKYQGFLPLAAP